MDDDVAAALDDLQKRLEAASNVIRLLLDFIGEKAHAAHVAAAALRRIVEDKGLIVDDEWKQAVAAVEEEEQTLFQLDPDVQMQLEELRRIFRKEPES